MAERYPIQFMIRISEELRDRIEQDALSQDRPMAYVARKVLEDHYEITSQKQTLSAYKP